jgi:hypothetical protein
MKTASAVVAIILGPVLAMSAGAQAPAHNNPNPCQS